MYFLGTSEARPMKSRQHGCPNTNRTRTTPMNMPNWMWGEEKSLPDLKQEGNHTQYWKSSKLLSASEIIVIEENSPATNLLNQYNPEQHSINICPVPTGKCNLHPSSKKFHLTTDIKHYRKPFCILWASNSHHQTAPTLHPMTHSLVIKIIMSPTRNFNLMMS